MFNKSTLGQDFDRGCFYLSKHNINFKGDYL